MDWIDATTSPPPLGLKVWGWNGEPHVVRLVTWTMLGGKQEQLFIGPDTIPVRGITHYSYIVAPDETA